VELKNVYLIGVENRKLGTRGWNSTKEGGMGKGLF
jgi:hypothetical protein